jgi:predicted phosphodiesterase
METKRNVIRVTDSERELVNKMRLGDFSVEDLEDTIKPLNKMNRALLSARDDLRITRKQIKNMAKTIDELESALQYEKPEIDLRPYPISQKDGSTTAIITLSDLHAEELVPPHTLDGNTYDIDTAKKRLREYFGSACSLVKSRQYTHVVLWLGGDLINGGIHEELAETNTLSPMEALKFVYEELCIGMSMLASISNLSVVCNWGNHSRITKTTHTINGYGNSLEWMMYKWLEKEFPTIQFIISSGDYATVDLYGKKVSFTHGHNIKTSNLYSTLDQEADRLKLHFDIDFCFYAHFHRLTLGRRWLVNGSFVGYSPYAESKQFAPERPEQAIITFNEKGLQAFEKIQIS